MSNTERACIRCGQVKPLGEYNVRGRDYRCRACKKSENHQRYLERRQEYYERSTAWRREHPEGWHRITDSWRRRNLAKDCAKALARQRQLKAAPGSHTREEWLAVKERYGHRCACCGQPDGNGTAKLTKDHIVPISVGGADHISNLQPLCVVCNARKGAHTIDYRAATRQ